MRVDGQGQPQALAGGMCGGGRWGLASCRGGGHGGHQSPLEFKGRRWHMGTRVLGRGWWAWLDLAESCILSAVQWAAIKEGRAGSRMRVWTQCLWYRSRWPLVSLVLDVITRSCIGSSGGQQTLGMMVVWHERSWLGGTEGGCTPWLVGSTVMAAAGLETHAVQQEPGLGACAVGYCPRQC